MSLNDTVENQVLDKLFGATDFTPSATYYLALGTDASPSDSTFTELSGNGYARTPIANNKTNFAVASGGSVANAAAFVCPEASAQWAQATCFAYFDAATGGNRKAWGLLGTPVTALANQCLRFPIGSLVATCD